MELKKKILVGVASVIIFVSCGIYYFLQRDDGDAFEIENSIEIFENISNEEQFDKINENNEIIEDDKIVVHIAGCIVNPGVISLKIGSRVIDAINEAGGTTRRSGFK